jgi:chromosomal replication initiator protein
LGIAKLRPSKQLRRLIPGGKTAVVDGIVEIPLPGRASDRIGDHAAAGLPSFIAGPENRLAGVVLESVLDEAHQDYSPLVIYGGTGTGKSHLVHGIAAAWKLRYPGRPAVLTTAIDFARRLADAIETQTVDDFVAEHRTAALLIVEDLQYLADKRAAQEELLAVMDAIAALNGRVVVTASTAPRQIAGLLPGLAGRLTGGLIVPLAPPSAAARRLLLERLASMRDLALPEAVACLLAEGLSGGVPELHAAVTHLATAARLGGGEITTAVAQRYLAERQAQGEPTLRDVALATARHFSLKLSDLRSASRRRNIVTARDVAMYLARRLTHHSLEQIGAYFGGRDHTTVSHGCHKVEQSLSSDAAIRHAAVELHARLAPRGAPVEGEESRLWKTC